MKIKKDDIIKWSLIDSFGTLAYILLVVWVMINGEKLFGKMDNFFGPLIMLLLFIFSALITSSLVLGRPIWWYLESKKKEALSLFFYTSAWLFLILVIVILVKTFAA